MITLSVLDSSSFSAPSNIHSLQIRVRSLSISGVKLLYVSPSFFIKSYWPSTENEIAFEVNALCVRSPQPNKKCIHCEQGK